MFLHHQITSPPWNAWASGSVVFVVRRDLVLGVNFPRFSLGCADGDAGWDVMDGREVPWEVCLNACCRLNRYKRTGGIVLA